MTKRERPAARSRAGVMKRRTAALALAGVTAVCAVAGCVRSASVTHAPRDPLLRALPLYFYPPDDSTRPPRAVVFFFGNDVGFWDAHQRLAERLASDGYAVAGFDVKRFFTTLPDGVAARDSAYAAAVGPIIARAPRELHGDSVPLVIGGHSIGAEIALWTAAHVAEPRLAGVLAMSPGSRSHLRVTLSDITNGSEPRGPGSFSVPEQVAGLPAGVRVAIVRGAHDEFAFADSALVAAGGDRVSRFGVPFSGHSLKSLLVSAPVVERAMEYLVPPEGGAAAR